MRVSRIHLILFIFVAVMALVLANTGCGAVPKSAPGAVPNTPDPISVTMIYEGHEGAGSDGAPYIGYPYYFAIDGSSSDTALMCDSFDNSIMVGETWQATVNPFLTGTGLYGPSASLDYRAAGLIFKGMLAGTLSSNQAQWAIWGLFSSEARSQPYFSSIGGEAIESTYLGLAATAPNSAYTGLFVYTPIAGTQSWGGLPQEFIGYTAP